WWRRAWRSSWESATGTGWFSIAASRRAKPCRTCTCTCWAAVSSACLRGDALCKIVRETTLLATAAASGELLEREFMRLFWILTLALTVGCNRASGPEPGDTAPSTPAEAGAFLGVPDDQSRKVGANTRSRRWPMWRP